MDDTRPTVEVELGPVSIVWVETDPGPCACGGAIGWGLVGFRRDDPQGPVCDKCLLKLHEDVGLAMRMIHIARELASNATHDDGRADRFMVALAAFAKLYNLAATWPPREVAVTEFVEKLNASMAAERWEAGSVQ